MKDITVNPERIRLAIAKVNAIRAAFETSHREAQNAVRDCGWTGAAATAFNNMFEEASTQFENVKEQITGIGRALQSGLDGLVTTDEQIATGIGGR